MVSGFLTAGGAANFGWFVQRAAVGRGLLARGPRVDPGGRTGDVVVPAEHVDLPADRSEGRGQRSAGSPVADDPGPATLHRLVARPHRSEAVGRRPRQRRRPRPTPGRGRGRAAAPARSGAATCGGGAPAGRARRPRRPSIHSTSTSRVRGPHRSSRTRVGRRLEAVADRQQLRAPSRSVSSSTTRLRNGALLGAADRVGLVDRRHGPTADGHQPVDRLGQEPLPVPEVRPEPEERPGHGRSARARRQAGRWPGRGAPAAGACGRPPRRRRCARRRRGRPRRRVRRAARAGRRGRSVTPPRPRSQTAP